MALASVVRPSLLQSTTIEDTDTIQIAHELESDLSDSEPSPRNVAHVSSSTPTLDEDAPLLNARQSTPAFSSSVDDEDNVGIPYYVNDELSLRHRMPLPATVPTISLAEFTRWLKTHHRPPLDDEFAVWEQAPDDHVLHVLKRGSDLTASTTYYVIDSAKLQTVMKELEKRLKKSMARSATGKPVYTSTNMPLKVDWVAHGEMYINEMGRLGLCMAPGRTKKKSEHIWARDLLQDLQRLRDNYRCDVLVTLLRTQEMRDISVPHLLTEAAKHGMESIHMPIKDKWVPNSMEQLMRLVEAIIARLRKGLRVVVHCNGGKGRSGTVLVATLVGLGRRVQQAIDVVRATRAETIRNPLQIAYVKRFKSAWFKRLSQRRALAASTPPSPMLTAPDEVLNAEEAALWRKYLTDHAKIRHKDDIEGRELTASSEEVDRDGIITDSHGESSEKRLMKNVSPVKIERDDEGNDKDRRTKDKKKDRVKEKEEKEREKEREKEEKERRKVEKRERKLRAKSERRQRSDQGITITRSHNGRLVREEHSSESSSVTDRRMISTTPIEETVLPVDMMLLKSPVERTKSNNGLMDPSAESSE